MGSNPTGRGSTGVQCPIVQDGLTSAWAQYTVKLAEGQRDQLAAALKEVGVPTAIYYPKPLHEHTAYKDYPVQVGGLPIASRLSNQVLSLPMHPYLALDDQRYILDHLVHNI